MDYLQALQQTLNGTPYGGSSSYPSYTPKRMPGRRFNGPKTKAIEPAKEPPKPLPSIVFDCPVPANMADSVTNVLQTLYDRGIDLNNCHVEAKDEEVYFPGGNYHYRSIKLTVAGHTIEVSADLAGKYPDVTANEILSMMGVRQG